MRHLALLLLLALSLAGCGASAEDATASIGDASTEAATAASDVTDLLATLDGTSWVLDSDREPPFPTLQVTGIAVGGSDGCNTYGAELVIQGDAVVGVGPIRSTRMACESHAHADFLQTLGELTRARLVEGTLVLTTPGDDLVFVAS